MPGNFRLSFWVLIVVMIVLPSCGSQTINFPSPVITSISPTTVKQYSPLIDVTVNGRSFVQGATVGISTTPNGTPIALTTLFIEGPGNVPALVATLTAGQLDVAQTYYFSVTTPQPGGGTYPPANQTKIIFPFVVSPAASPVPHIASISPSTALAATSSALNVFLTGTSFVPQSVATVNGINLTTTFLSPTSLEAVVTGTNLAAPGADEIAVLNPAPGGGLSNQIALSVVNPVPTVASITPTSVLVGSTTTTSNTLITVTGTGFVPQYTTITLNGGAFPTLVTGATTATIVLTPADLALGGVQQIAAVNNAPGGGVSTPQPFAINPTHLIGMPILVDLAADGSQANSGICGGQQNCQTGGLGLTTNTVGPSSSGSGQFVAFASASHNLVLSDMNPGTDVYLRNTCLADAACVPLTSVISTDADGNDANGSSSQPTTDSSGTHAAFTSLATNLVTSVAIPSGTTQVYWRPVCVQSSTNSCTGTTLQSLLTQLVSISADGLSAGNGPSYDPVISTDGRYVAFVSLATNLVSNIAPAGAMPQVYIRDTCNLSTAVNTGTCEPITYLVSTPDGSTPGNGPSSNPSIAGSGLFVSFTSLSTNLGATAPNPQGASEIFDRSTCITTLTSTTNTCSPLTTLVSTPDGATAADGSSDQSNISNCGAPTTAVECGVSNTAENGRFIAFASTATNLVVNSGSTQQIYVRDTCTGIDTVVTQCVPSTSLVSISNGAPGNGLSERPSLSATGQFVAFASLASNLANTTNGVENIFVRNTCFAVTVTCTPGTAIASIGNGTNASPSNGASLVPSISADGHTVSFLSFSNNLVPRDNNALEDIFLGTTTF